MPRINNYIQSVIKPYSGQTLDIIKLAAICLMTIDHLGKIIFYDDNANFWFFGRAAFPLFAFAFACNLARKPGTFKTTIRLLVFGMVATPFYARAFHAWPYLNIMFTFAAALLLDRLLTGKPDKIIYAVTVIALAWFIPSNQIIEYGTAGIVLPTLIKRVLQGQIQFILPSLLCLTALNTHLELGWMVSALGIIATVFIPIFLLTQVRNWLDAPRFLPKHFFYFYYPIHIGLLIVLGRFFAV